MKLTEAIERGLTVWTATVAAAVEAVADRQLKRSRVVVRLDQPGRIALTVQVPSKAKPVLAPAKVNLTEGAPHVTLSPEWLRTLRGASLEIHLTAENVLVRPLDFPKQAEPFLDGMIRTQIGRLTPWHIDQALYGFSATHPVANDRIALTLAATPRALVQPLLAFADEVGAAKLVITAEVGAADGVPIQIFKSSLRSSLAGGRDLGRVLKLGWLSVAATTAVLLIATTLIGGYLDGELDDAQAQVTRLRAALRPAIGATAADGLLAKRKQTSPASVIVLDTLSKILPDGTYVIELHVENDRLQISGLTQDAPALIRLIEQSPQFSRATFYAPTTRTAGETGERFHIEARINAFFGDRA
ncbi:general secretion pathway protein L, GspL [Bradyrhizobium oligotrophicum S58]|uniref:General secretion pathway protein L, GspL n=1 Tax=Bradyrhizobium oligotrophicum S58 TaxID=1245469 RepID=M5A0Y7_9BRAD|nr:PilN domain-containing protein [Bradyrhizobium oligotrophicum]BAM92480.1 general secretion pathway protein L, GspL [Bradyrhizobium oligotrophicum S58]